MGTIQWGFGTKYFTVSSSSHHAPQSIIFVCVAVPLTKIGKSLVLGQPTDSHSRVRRVATTVPRPTHQSCQHCVVGRRAIIVTRYNRSEARVSVRSDRVGSPAGLRGSGSGRVNRIVILPPGGAC